MASKLKSLPAVTRTGGGRTEKYPYEKWFDGSVWQLTQGEDFESEPAVFGNTLRTAARRHGVTLSIVMIEDDSLALQASSGNGKAKASDAPRKTAKPKASGKKTAKKTSKR
jgi:hypothetical protein